MAEQKPRYGKGDKVEYNGQTCEIWWVSGTAPYTYRVYGWLNFIPEEVLKPCL